jgi:hypothetical protein
LPGCSNMLSRSEAVPPSGARKRGAPRKTRTTVIRGDGAGSRLTVRP